MPERLASDTISSTMILFKGLGVYVDMWERMQKKGARNVQEWSAFEPGAHLARRVYSDHNVCVPYSATGRRYSYSNAAFWRRGDVFITKGANGARDD